MKKFYTSLKKYIVAHKIITAVVVVAVVIVGYVGYKKAFGATAETKYVLGTVEKGTLISSVSATGQVAANQQVDIKPNVSGNVVKVYVQQGQQVKAGDVLVQIDSRTASQNVINAQNSLKDAQIALQKLKLQDTDTLSQATESKESAQGSLSKAYDDGYNTATSAFADMPDIINSMRTVLNNSEILAIAQQNVDHGAYTILQTASQDLAIAQEAVTSAQLIYNATPHSASGADIETLIDKTYLASNAVHQTVADTQNLIRYLQDNNQYSSSGLTSNKTTVDNAATKITSDVSGLSSAKNGILTANNTIDASDRTLASAQASNNGQSSSALDLQSAQLTVAQRQADLATAESNLSDYYIKAPFDGVVASLSAQVGYSAASSASASSGSSIATIITPDKYAQVSLNEVDASKIKVGDKATLTFDALPDLSLTGTVAEVDTIGTVSQGVVSYGVKISFDTQDDSVKPGMSASASVMTSVKPDVLMIPTSAIKTSGNNSTVQVLDNAPASAVGNSAGITSATAPRSVTIQTGDSNDTDTEVTSGLNEGDVIVTRTISATTKTAATTSGAGILGGGNRGAGGATRALGR